MKYIFKLTISVLLIGMSASCTSFEVYDAGKNAAATPADRNLFYSSVLLGFWEVSEPASVTKLCSDGQAAKIVIRTAWYNGFLNFFRGYLLFSRTTEIYCSAE